MSEADDALKGFMLAITAVGTQMAQLMRHNGDLQASNNQLLARAREAEAALVEANNLVSIIREQRDAYRDRAIASNG